MYMTYKKFTIHRRAMSFELNFCVLPIRHISGHGLAPKYLVDVSLRIKSEFVYYLVFLCVNVHIQYTLYPGLSMHLLQLEFYHLSICISLNLLQLVSSANGTFRKVCKDDIRL